MAIAFATEGADVAINYLPAEESDAQEVIEMIRSAGRKAVALPGDIQDEIFCTGLVNSAVAQLGGLDILVNNAARQTAQDSIFDITTEQLDATYKTNVYHESIGEAVREQGYSRERGCAGPDRDAIAGVRRSQPRKAGPGRRRRRKRWSVNR